jgi:4-carboxymuconolactone decarboxylase
MEHRDATAVDWEPAGHEHFTGEVSFGAHHAPVDDDDLNVLGVSFEAGARTDWHRHPGGQVLYIVSGEAWVASEDGTRVVAGPGDSVYAPPGEVHWHGATAEGPMTHLSITHLGATVWMPRKVTEEEYAGQSPTHGGSPRPPIADVSP